MFNMFASKPEQKQLLYDGVSGNYEGRYQYLKERYKTQPGERYPFPVTASMDYGWYTTRHGTDTDTDDAEDTSRRTAMAALNGFPSQHAVRNVIMSNFYRPNGVLSEQFDLGCVKTRGTSNVFTL